MKNYVSRIKSVLKKNGKYNDGMTANRFYCNKPQHNGTLP